MNLKITNNNIIQLIKKIHQWNVKVGESRGKVLTELMQEQQPITQYALYSTYNNKVHKNCDLKDFGFLGMGKTEHSSLDEVKRPKKKNKQKGAEQKEWIMEARRSQ